MGKADPISHLGISISNLTYPKTNSWFHNSSGFSPSLVQFSDLYHPAAQPKTSRVLLIYLLIYQRVHLALFSKYIHGLTVLPYPLCYRLGKNRRCRDSLLASAILHPPLSEFSFKTLLRLFHSPALSLPAHSEIQLPCSGPSALQGSVRPYPIPQCYFSLLLLH